MVLPDAVDCQSQDKMNSQFWNPMSIMVIGQEVDDFLEPENPFEHAREAVSGQVSPSTIRTIRRREGNSESEEKQVLLSLHLASLLSCSQTTMGLISASVVGHRTGHLSAPSVRGSGATRKTYSNDWTSCTKRITFCKRSMSRT